MISCVHNYYLVIYTDLDGINFFFENFSQYMNTDTDIPHFTNTNIKIIIKPLETFYNYKYKNSWIDNHNKNIFLNNTTEWKLHMLWAEKTHLVFETANMKYFDTEYYGWCDIGYFREKPVPDFPSNKKIAELNKNKIYYGIVNNNKNATNMLFSIIQNKNVYGLPVIPIPPNQISVAAGFFIGHKTKIEWWKNTFDHKLKLYFKHNYLVKDDQIIVIDCIFSNIKHFHLVREIDSSNDIWFMFQRFLV
jgi:hypothetical protein